MKQESYFVWKPLFENRKNGKWRVSTRAIHAENYDGELVSAFTVAELGEMLPNAGKLVYTNRLNASWVGVFASETAPSVLQVSHTTQAVTEADARAKMLIYLLENKLISV